MSSQESDITSAAAKLEKPKGLQYVEATDSTITIAWDPVDNATGYMVLCKNVVYKSWSDCESTFTEDNSITATIEELYPTATFEIRVVALCKTGGYHDSDESESIFCDTMVGSCAPKKDRCCNVF